jgi:SAM-dependent methyltransferase
VPVTESLSAWLALRQEADFAARSERLTALILERLARIEPLRVLDLGTGTGSNIRYLAPRLRVGQHWLAIDKDPRLLTEAAVHGASVAPGVQVDTRALDLGAETPSDIFDGRHLVTASALLDLVSSEWMDWIASECRRVGACALFTITYNGWNECDPKDPDDASVFALFNLHQLSDKGLGGPAAGPRGTDVAREQFAAAGFDVQVEPSNWHIGPADREFQRQLIEGWAFAAAEMSPSESDIVEAWKQRRLTHVAAGHSTLVVGHHDLAAVPPRG